ncbi:hypothetical protein Xmau_03355 [Xenorhabdus mauleonii]|uniref:Uncharacterized protein n=1 Tax=Xenorhabdus mauleonii TaxID=351675 RepID=A0A1I3R0K0_9GAMM|nr:hypothetical protein [Xenorhabdus mauleonii]PHM38647.1 hypothetical protein Xmau_03355 [Xenorhabdus mauleonii]SFJ39868.1 hypothetical protein SAMN05421680_108104 [Xenorhabdus mauleonii]
MYEYIIRDYLSLPREILSSFIVLDNGKDGYYERGDNNRHNRIRITQELYPVFATEHKSLIRFLLEQEIESCALYEYGTDLMRALSYMLLTMADIEDSLLFYRTKFETHFDARCAMDIEPIFGEDKDKTKAYFLGKNQDVVNVIEYYEQFPYISKTDYIKQIQDHKLMEYWLYNND